MSAIRKYLTDIVIIVKVTLSRGERSEVEIPNVPAFITTIKTFVRDVSGDHFVDKTLVILEHDANITGQDEIKISGVSTPVSQIRSPKSTRSAVPSHLEVML